MTTNGILIVSTVIFVGMVNCGCNGDARATNSGAPARGDSTATTFGGFSNRLAYGHHLVIISGCNDCHTPKKMSPFGPVPDTSLMLSGHPSTAPSPNVNPKEIETKGLAATNDMTAWVGPWGTSYSANLTPDATGVGNWSEAQFMLAMREGKYKGLEGSRQLLPPMPWQNFAVMSDEELKAIFAYLQSIKPVHNVVPPPTPPVVGHH